ncbi:MAG: C45 family autoproteolytic acyltransferase/hydrolase [Deltaproteobacteria bacterium]|nr:C45 family autoproteolytic acyltransferase/hydrolase [Deltaproteobacteria bacterium]
MTPNEVITPIEFISLPDGRIKRVGRLNLITLSGSAYDMGFQHGVIAKELYVRGLIVFFTRFLRTLKLGLEDMVGSKYVRRQVGRLFDRYIQILGSNMARGYTGFMLDEIRGFADGSGETHGLLKKLMSMPDVLQILLARGLSRTVANSIAALNPGCSSAAVWGDATADGSLIYGRDLDFFDDHSMDRNPAVVLYMPDGGMKYATFGFLGVPGGGITGINEAGITVALHIMLSKNVSSYSTPVMNVSNEIIRNAESTDDAAKIARSYRFSSGWGIVVTDAHHRDAVVIEASSKHVLPRKAASTFIVNTNHYNTGLLKKKEYDYSVSATASTIGRYRRAEEIIREKHGRFTVDDMVLLLGDHLEYYTRRERALGSTITAVHNVSAVVMKPEEMKVWVSHGDAPSNNSDFIGVDLGSWMKGNLRLIDVKKPTPYVGTYSFTVFKEHYEQAYQKYFYHNDIPAALAELEQLTQKDTGEPIYFMLKGQLYVKVHRYGEAIEAFDRAIALPDIPHRTGVSMLWKARTQDILGMRGDAMDLYRGVCSMEGIGANLRKAARKGLRHRYSASKIKRHDIDFVFSDNTAY